ncbi:invasion associated locus B family protein [Methylocapsa polymorpha]|uniref:Invasion associated locus B family protein n=1 Tax=Methylocapsa polymorpha TaxID=3080828 RepID=A0ABZ0HTV3_9HYPH|nr:invasion associated locus B family protein [Methylocapsa sp. RX1]
MRRIFIAAISIGLLSPLIGQAQTRAKGQKPAEAPKAQQAPDSTTETFDDWSMVCGVLPGGSSERFCEVDATLTVRGQPGPVAKIAFASPAKDQPTRIVALVPVNVSFHTGVRIDLDPGKPAVDLPFKSCVPAACIAEAELTKDQVQNFRSPLQTGQLNFEDAAGKPASLQFSYRGLDKALDAFFKRQDK